MVPWWGWALVAFGAFWTLVFVAVLIVIVVAASRE